MTVRPLAADRAVARRFIVGTCRAEWARLRTVRATWWLVAATAAVMLGMTLPAAFSVADLQDPPVGDSAWSFVQITALPAQFALLAIALTAVTSDYATGGIVPTLQWTPRRRVLFVARTVVPVGFATATGVLIAAASGIAAWAAARPVLVLPWKEGLAVLGNVGWVFASGAALAVGIGFVLRSTAAGLVSLFLLLLVLPGLLPQMGSAWLAEVADSLPGTNALFLLAEEPNDRGLSVGTARLIMCGWAAGALALGATRLIRDDANR